MKYNINKFVLSIILLVLIGTSCKNEKFFELKRAPEFPWQSVSEYEKAAIGAYNASIAGQWWGALPSVDILMDFVMSENVRFVVGSVQGFPDQIVNGRKFTQTCDRVDNAFQRAYQTIAACNTSLEFYETNNGNPFPNATVADKTDNVNRIAGELHFLRAYTYFFLVRYYHPPFDPNGANDFKGLPYRPKLSSSMGEALNPEFYTTKEFYDAIVADLKKAKLLLPEKFNASTMNAAYQYGRATRFAASAILARVYMIMGNLSGNESAETEYDYIINSGQFSLEASPLNNYNRSYNNYKETSHEIIWEMFNANQSGGASPYGELSHFMKCSLFRNDFSRRNPLFTPVENFASTGGRGNNWDFAGWAQYSLSQNVLKEKIKWMNEDGSLSENARNDKRYREVYYYMREYKKDIDKSLGEDTLFLSPSWATQENQPTIWVDKAYRGIEAMLHNTPLIRYAEPLVHRAAIRFHAGNKQGAAEDLNVVRKRAWGNSSVAFENSSEFLNASNITEDIITAEHIKELSGEACWFVYQQAFRRPIGQPDIPNPPQVINPPYSEMHWPIPASETMFYNQN